MKSGSLLFAALGALVIACSGSVSEVDEQTGSADDELSLSKAACSGKSCGDPCSLCPPWKKNCFETAVLKACNEDGRCTPSVPVCGAIDAGPGPTDPIDAGPGPTDPIDAGPAPYAPCAGKACGETCKLCPPGDPNCFETAVLKMCHADGTCSPSLPACIPPPPHDPCAGKACGETCRLCPPGDPNCFETAVLKACDAAGQCTASVPVCGP